MQFSINSEVAAELAVIFAEQAARADEDGIGPVLFTKQGLDGTVVVAFPSDGRTFEISGGGTREEI